MSVLKLPIFSITTMSVIIIICAKRIVNPEKYLVKLEVRLYQHYYHTYVSPIVEYTQQFHKAVAVLSLTHEGVSMHIKTRVFLLGK